MEKINIFIQKFCDIKINNLHKVGRRYYQVSPEVWNLNQSIDRDIYHFGTYLGEFKKHFNPSLELLSILSKNSKKKIFLNEKGEWMFQCKRDIFEENIKRTDVQKGLCLVQNSLDENLGYGNFQGNKLKPLLDRGNFLRRE